MSTKTVFSVIQSAESKSSSCREHGKYTSTKAPNGMWSQCPQCMRDNDKSESLVSQAQERAEVRASGAIRRLEEMHVKAEIPRRFRSKSLDNYHAVSPEQQGCLRACQLYLKNFDRQFENGGGLVFLGKPGTGKTHLAAAIGNALLERGHSVLFVDVYNLIDSIKEAAFDQKQCSELQARRRFSEVDLLILDEVGAQLGSDWEKLTLFKVINDRYKQMLPTILISNRNREEFRAYVTAPVEDRMLEGGGAFLTFDWASHRGQPELRGV